MRRPFVKVCGITRLEDARAAAKLGAAAVGFIFHPSSPRAVGVEAAAAIAADLPPGVAKVGVTVDLPTERVRELAARAGLTAIQAHGDETPGLCREYGLPVIKAIATRPGLSRESLEPYREFPILLDAYQTGVRGGTGQRADWSLARMLVEDGFRVLLAGGLGPSSIRDAVEAVGPLAVDLNSGVERSPGIKDRRLLTNAVRALDDLSPIPEKESPW